MNSPNNSAARSRRFNWLRRLLWACICLVSLLTLYYQWENWRSAKELKAAHLRMMERIGTDDPVVFAPPKIADEENFFALPVITQWATGELERGSHFKRYHIPKDVFLPKDFQKPALIENEEGGASRIDFAAWARDRALHGESPAVVMNRELGDANGLLPQLIAGLNRPFSCIKPGHREALEDAGENPYDAAFPNISSINDHMKALGLHLRCAAAAGDVEKTEKVSLVLLRLFPESVASHGRIITSLVSVAAHGLAFEALQDALGRPAWNETSLHALQMHLGKINDLEVIEQALCSEALLGFGAGIYIREAARRGDKQLYDWNWGHSGQDWGTRLMHVVSFCAVVCGPGGWHDANIAFFVDRQLDMIGPRGETSWLDAARRGEELKKLLAAEYQHLAWNPRRAIGAMALPNVGNLWYSAAETLFHRRCLIIACALEKHRLRHGSYPASLDAVRDGLKLFQVNDPARPSQSLSYRLEPNGYLLWSAGSDARDDGGVQENDWLWRMRRD